MMNRICYVTGVPAVGKSTLCKTMVEKYPEVYRHVGFGHLIRVALKELGGKISEHEIRQNTTRLVSPKVLERATMLLHNELGSSTGREDRWTLLDSHAVSQDWFGFIATPDGSRYFANVTYRELASRIWTGR